MNKKVIAVIPVAGAGTNLRPLTFTQPKALIPLAGKPILSHIVDQLIENGIEDFIFVIGYLGEKIEEFIRAKYPNLQVRFVTQNPRLGLAHALSFIENLIDNETLLIVLGDTICEFEMQNILKNDCNCIGVAKVEDPTQFGIVEIINEEVSFLVEKPAIPKSNLAMVGIYKIQETKKLFESIKNVLKDDKNKVMDEFPLTLALQDMLENGSVFKKFNTSRWFDCGKKESLLNTNKILLEKEIEKLKIDGQIKSNNILIPPVFIDENCKIENSIIGPYVSIGNNTTIKESFIKNTIIGSYSTIENVQLEKSLIGSDVLLKGYKNQLNIGDNTELDLTV